MSSLHTNSDVSQGFRLSPQQRRLLTLQREVSESAFIARCSISIDGNIDMSVLEKALEYILGAHEIFRTAFRSTLIASFPLQVITETVKVYWQYREDLSALSQEEQEARLATIRQDMASPAVDWIQSPLFCASFVTVAPRTHILFITVSALWADTDTMNNLGHEIGSVYSMLKNNQAEPEGEEVLQYADIAEWQNELLTAPETEAGRKYWRQQNLTHLFSAVHPFEMQSESKLFHPTRLTSVLSSTIRKNIEEIAQRYHGSCASFLLACWQVLLWRLTEKAYIAIGVGCDGRRFEELKHAPGLLEKYLPFVSEAEEQATFSEVLEKTSIMLAHVDEQQEYFSWEQSETIPLFPDSIPYFPLCFICKEECKTYRNGDIAVTVDDCYVCNDLFHVKLSCTCASNSILLDFHYDARRFSQEAVACLAEQFSTLVENALCTPDAPVQSLGIVSAAESQRVRIQFNNTVTPFSNAISVVDMFDASAAPGSDAVAVVYGEHYLTYAALYHCVMHMAQYLRKLKVEPEDRVGLYMERSTELVIAILGILYVGGCYVPLDPEYPQERLDFMLEDAQVKVLMTQERFQSRFVSSNNPVVCVEKRTWLESDRAQPEAVKRNITGEMSAYIIYTSGSTGHPKGVVIPHRALANHMSWMNMALPLTLEDRVLQKTSFSFDASVWEFLAPLLVGAQLIVAPPRIQQDSHALIETITMYQVTILQVVPSLLRILLVDEQDFKQCTSLRRVLCGGERLTADLQHQFFLCSSAGLYNLYGPTESCIDATMWECRRENESRKVLIGRPIANTQVYILNAQQQPVAIGCSGEIYIGGSGLARGYLNRPDITAERFIPDAFSGNTGGRLYRTGDMGRFFPDGTIEYASRIDHQVKFRGFRIELEEIETVLARHPAIDKSIVLLKEGASGEEAMVAYLSLDKQHAFTLHRLLELEEKGLLQKEDQYVLPNGMVVAYLNKSETAYVYKEIFQDQEYAKHGITFSAGDCIFDVGANIGIFTLFASRVAPNVSIYAFEPIPAICNLLHLNASLYNPNVKVFACGLADSSKSALFTFYPNVSLISGRYANSDDEENVIQLFLANQQQIVLEDIKLYQEMIKQRLHTEQVTCHLRTISEVIREQKIKQIDLLKIDVEKSELEVLNGIAEEDWSKIKQIVIEVHDIHGRLAQIQECLKKRQYRVSVEQEATLKGTNLYNLFAIHQSVQREKSENIGYQRDEEWFNRSSLLNNVQQYVSEKLPSYMLPSQYFIINEWPLTPNGKIDLQALPGPEQALTEPDSEYTAPRTKVEAILSEIWAEVLKLERVGIHTNFFKAGGHSLLVTRVISRIQKTFGIKLPIRSLFEKPTIAELALDLPEIQ